jgi:phage shock protein PspC (stress-responsive transcriptional regulator)
MTDEPADATPEPARGAEQAGAQGAPGPGEGPAPGPGPAAGGAARAGGPAGPGDAQGPSGTTAAGGGSTTTTTTTTTTRNAGRAGVPAPDPDLNAEPDRDAEADADLDADRPRLARGRGKNKVIAGVCHGAGVYFGVDPVIFRIVLTVLSLTGGIGLIIYGTAWLVVPQEGERESEAHRLLSGRIEGAPLTAVLMALVGCGLYASMIGNGANQAFSLLLLAATAGAVYWSQQRRRLEQAGEAPFTAAGTGGATRAPTVVPDAPPAVQAPPEPGGAPSWWRDPLTKEPSYLWGPDDGPYGAQDRRAWRDRRRATARQERRLWVFGLVVFLLAVAAAATGTGVAWPYQPAGAALEIGLAAALGVFGTAFVIASFAGRARGGTAFWSVVTIAALIGAAALPKSGRGLGGTQEWRPRTASAMEESYERGVGTGSLDLSALRLPRGAVVDTDLKVGVGEADVRLPADTVVHIVYSVGIGDVILPGKGHSGVNIKNAHHEQLTYGPAPGTAAAVSAGTVNLDVSVGVGELRVIR